MANTSPTIDSVDLLSRLRREAPLKTPVHILFLAAVSHGLEGTRLTDFAALAAAGAVAFSDDGRGIEDSELMRRALISARAVGRPVVVHEEDPRLSAGGVMHRGRRSAELGLPGQSASAEAAMVARDLVLSEETGAHVHIQHVSTRLSVALIRDAKRRGVPVTAEVTPHHLLLCEDDVGYEADFKMNPPLRSADDRAALREALRDGTFDAIATDHAPHSASEKQAGILTAPFGIIGLETALGLVLTELVDQDLVGLEQALALMTHGPRRCLDLPEEHLSEGVRADLTVIDRERPWRVDVSSLRSKSKNTPFIGHELRGKARGCIIDGRWYEA